MSLPYMSHVRLVLLVEENGGAYISSPLHHHQRAYWQPFSVNDEGGGGWSYREGGKAATRVEVVDLAMSTLPLQLLSRRPEKKEDAGTSRR